MAKSKNQRKPIKKMHQNLNQNQQPPKAEKPPSWVSVKSLFTSKHLQVEQTQKEVNEEEKPFEESNKKYKKMKCSGSLCNNTKIMQRPEASSTEESKRRALNGSLSSNGSSSRTMKAPLNEINGTLSKSTLSSSSFSASSNSSVGGSFRGMPFRRFSGCYECRMVVDPVLGLTKDPSLKSTIRSCPDCGEIFMRAETLELHQSIRHAVSELGPEDTSKNIVEIIFQSSWLKKHTPVCTIERILKVQNTPKTISRFEEYRESIKAKASKFPKKNPRCVADGNELLRFYCTTFLCSIGLNGSSNLCNSIPKCYVCSIIKAGFKAVGGVIGKGICTTATSGKAHDLVTGVLQDHEKRAMLVCRVIAGRIKRGVEGSTEDYDSVAGGVGGVYSSLEELYVCNPRAILPCFVVIYGGF